MSLASFSSLLCRGVKVTKNQKNKCVSRGQADVPQPSAPAAARRPRRLRAVRSAPPRRGSRRSGSNYHPRSISEVFAFNAECGLFLSPPVVSASHTHTHSHTAAPGLLPPSLWLSGNGQLDGTVHLQESSSLCHAPLRSPAPAGPGGAAGRLWAGGRRGSELGRPPLPREPPGSSVRAPVLPPLAERSQLVLSRRLSVSPISSTSRPAAAPRPLLQALRAEPHAAQPRPLRASWAGRKGSRLAPLSPAPGTVTSEKVCKFQHPTGVSKLCHFAEGGGGDRGNQSDYWRKQCIRFSNQTRLS